MNEENTNGPEQANTETVSPDQATIDETKAGSDGAALDGVSTS